MAKEKNFFEKEVFSKEDYEFTFKLDNETIRDILKYKKTGKLLDLGCGEGGNSLALAEKGFNVTCVDISKTAIKKIKEEAKKRNIKIKAIIADLEKYEIDKEYDVIIGTGVFHFILRKKIYALLKKVKDHTKIGGINLFEVFLEGDHSQEEDSEGYYFTKGELKKIYEGWEILNYEEYDDYDKEMKWNNKLAQIIAKKR